MKMSTRKLVSLAVMAAISVVLVYFIHIPMFLPFLEYDPADIIVLIATFAYGPVTGLVLTVVVSVAQWWLVSQQSGVIGALMHIVSTGSLILVAGWIYRIRKNRLVALIALICGSLAMTASMVGWNIIFTPLFMGTPRSEVYAILGSAIVPFNLVKAGVNSMVTFLLYKKISHVIKGREELETVDNSRGIGA